MKKMEKAHIRQNLVVNDTPLAVSQRGAELIEVCERVELAFHCHQAYRLAGRYFRQNDMSSVVVQKNVSI